MRSHRHLVGESFPEAVRRFTEGRGVQVLYDAVGKDIFEDSINLPAPRGHLVELGQAWAT